MPEVGIIGSCSLTFRGSEIFNYKGTSSDSIQKRKDITSEEQDDFKKSSASGQGKNGHTFSVEETVQNVDTDAAIDKDSETNTEIGTRRYDSNDNTKTNVVSNGKNKTIDTCKSMTLDNNEIMTIQKAKLKLGFYEMRARLAASNLNTRSYHGSYSTYFGGNAISGIRLQDNRKQFAYYTPISYQYQPNNIFHKQHETDIKLAVKEIPILDVGKSVIGTSDVNGIFKKIEGIGELYADGTFHTTSEKLRFLFESSHAVNASEEVNHQNGEVNREIKPLRPYAGDLLPTLSENDNNSENNLEKQAIVLLSYEENKNDDGDENDTEAKKSRKLTFRLNVITPEHFREAMRDAQMNTYELTYSRLFPNNCRLFIELPINRHGIIGRTEKKAVKNTINERKINRSPRHERLFCR